MLRDFEISWWAMRAVAVAGLALGLIGCGRGLEPRDPHDVARSALAEAAGDEGALKNLLADSVTHGGLWFADPTCAAELAEPGEIGKPRLAAFARCLRGLHLQPSSREHALGDVVVMTYAPGFEVAARVVQEAAGPRLTWIGYVGRRDLADDLPTISAEALEGLRTSGHRHDPLDPAVAGTLAPAGEATWLKVCLDETGAVVGARPDETTSPQASTAFEAVVRSWQFRPFTVEGRAIPVCSMVYMVHPPERAPVTETLPLPPPPSRGKQPIVFAEGSGRELVEAKRIQGQVAIKPDAQTATAIQRSKQRRIRGVFRVCLDETGKVESVLPKRSTGFASYDRDLIAHMHQWLYSPFLVDGQPFPVCTIVELLYRQR